MTADDAFKEVIDQIASDQDRIRELKKNAHNFEIERTLDVLGNEFTLLKMRVIDMRYKNATNEIPKQ